MIGIKELIVVLTIAVVVFHLGKPIALLFSSEADYSRRRNVWFLLTITAFLSPSFWLFVLVATPILIWAGRRDTNPIALYIILLHVIPPIPVEIPPVAVKQLFDLDNFRLLSFCVLIPAAWRLRRSRDTEHIRGLTVADLSILAFGVMQLINFVPPDLPDHTILQDSPTNVLRRGFLFLVDTYILYYVVSRSCSTRRALIDTMGAFCLAGAVMASVAVFETLRRWLLYSYLGARWGIPHVYGTQYGFYFVRDGFLRAQASAGHASSLAYFLAIAFGFWLYLNSHVKLARWRVAVGGLFWLGLLATQARAPILGAFGIFLVFSFLGPNAMSRLLKTVAFVAVVAGIVSLTPYGERTMSSLPLLGYSRDDASVAYRERLVERSWELIQLHPFLGDPLAMTKMEDLRQGEGIIDLVNAYAGTTLFDGAIGLLLFMAAILVGLFNAYRTTREVARRDTDYALLGVSLVACILGTLLIISANSLVYAYEKVFYILAGLAAAYAFAGKLSERR